MSFTTKIFGVIPLDSDGAYWSGETTVSGRSLVRSLFISNELSGKSELLDRAAALLNDLETLDARARELIRAVLNGPDDTVREYIKFHLDELTDEEIESLFGAPKATVSPSMFLSKLDLVGAAIHPSLVHATPHLAPPSLRSDLVGLRPPHEGFKLVLDYSLGRSISDQLLAVTFDSNGSVVQVSHES